MDEVLFHASESVEALQVQLLSRFQQGREILNSYTDHLQSWANTPVANHIQHSINQAWVIIHHFLNEIKEIAGKVGNPQPFVSRILLLLGVDSASISVYYGSLGFLLGVGVGVLVGLSCHRPTLPVQKMSAVVCTSYAGIDAVSAVDDICCPQIRNSDEVLVLVKAASVDPVDISICSGYGHILRRHLGHYSSNVTSEFPIILGRDCAGVIIELGQNVSNFELGDEVWFSVPYWASGVLAEYAVVKQSLLAHKPKGITFEVAASLPYTGMLAWNAMVQQAGLNPTTCCGRRVLVHTCCSAVGCLLVQLAHLWGAHVTVTCPLRVTPVAQALGADTIVVSGDGCDVEKQLLQLDMFDVVFNTTGMNAHKMCLKFCRRDGHVISTTAAPLSSDACGLISGSIYSVVLKIKYFIWNLVGANVWTSTIVNPAVLESLGAMVETGGLQPVVDKIFSPQDAELAFQHVEQGESVGKTVIRFRSRKSHSSIRKRSSKSRKHNRSHGNILSAQ